MSWPAHPDDFHVGQKVWFHGLKAKVVTGFWKIQDDYPLWAVPIQIKGAEGVTIAHVDDLIPRKKGEAWI